MLLVAAVADAQNLTYGLQAQGSTFAFPVYSEWGFAYNLIKSQVSLTYLPTGSGAGIRALLTGNWDYCGSDSPASAAQYAQRPDLQFYPFFGGGIVLIYNLPTLTSANYQLILDRPTIARIFNGSITMWNEKPVE